MKMRAFEKKIAIRAILHTMVIGRGDTVYWLASDFLGMTQSSKSTILRELNRLVDLGYLEKTIDPYRPNSNIHKFVWTGKVGFETTNSSHWYSVLKYNILGVSNE